MEVCSTFLPAYNNCFVAATAARSSLLAAYLAALLLLPWQLKRLMFRIPMSSPQSIRMFGCFEGMIHSFLREPYCAGRFLR